MTILRANRTPVRLLAAGYVLDFVERVLNIGSELRAGIYVFLLQGISGIYGEHRFHVQVFAPFQEFEQTHSVRRLVMPGARVRWPIHERTNGLLPFEAIGDVIAFQVIPARKTQKGRV